MTEGQLRRLFEAQATHLKYSVKRGPQAYVSAKTETMWLGFQLGVFVISQAVAQGVPLQSGVEVTTPVAPQEP